MYVYKYTFPFLKNRSMFQNESALKYSWHLLLDLKTNPFKNYLRFVYFKQSHIISKQFICRGQSEFLIDHQNVYMKDVKSNAFIKQVGKLNRTQTKIWRGILIPVHTFSFISVYI